LTSADIVFVLKREFQYFG